MDDGRIAVCLTAPSPPPCGRPSARPSVRPLAVRARYATATRVPNAPPSPRPPRHGNVESTCKICMYVCMYVCIYPSLCGAVPDDVEPQRGMHAAAERTDLD